MKIDPTRLRHIQSVAERADAELRGLSNRQPDLRAALEKATRTLHAEEQRQSVRSTHSFPGSRRRDPAHNDAEDAAAATALAVLKADVDTCRGELERNATLREEATARRDAAFQLAERCQDFVTNGKQEATQ